MEDRLTASNPLYNQTSTSVIIGIEKNYRRYIYICIYVRVYINHI